MLIAVCRQDRPDRVDVTEWVTPEQWTMRFQAAELNGDVGEDGYRVLGAAVILLGQDIGFEYPAEARTLLAGLDALGVDRSSVLSVLGTVAAINAHLDAVPVHGEYDQVVRPLCLFLGTPSRRMPGSGRKRTHLVCWRIDQTGQQVLAAARSPGSSDQRSRPGRAAWLDQAATTWIPVMEARPEVTIRRDSGTPSAWLSGKRVLVLGCGALGAPAAEICVRAGAAEVTIADNGIVSPGILVRQPYQDADIGQYKATALAWRLNQIHADNRVSALPQDIIVTVLTGGDERRPVRPHHRRHRQRRRSITPGILARPVTRWLAPGHDHAHRAPGPPRRRSASPARSNRRRPRHLAQARPSRIHLTRPGSWPTSARTSSRTLRGPSSSSPSPDARTPHSPDQRPRPEPWPRT